MKQRIKIILLLLFSFQLSNELFSQEVITLRGSIFDSITLKAIPYVNIIEKGTSIGVVSNENGMFQISIISNKKDSLYISCIGYMPTTISLDNINDISLNQIKLSPSIYLINTIEIKSYQTPLEIVRNAINNISVNYCADPFLIEGFYREYTKENNKYGRLLEANISVYDEGYKKHAPNPLQLYSSEDFKINALYNHDKNIKLQVNVNKVNNLECFFHYNPVKYYRTPFNLKKLEEFDFKIDSSTYFENELYYIISFKSKVTNTYGSMLINSSDYAFVTVNVNNYNKKQTFINDEIIQTLPENYTIKYRKFNNHYFVYYMRRNWGLQTLDKQFNIIHQREIFTEFMKNNVICGNVKNFDKSELMDKKKDLFLQFESFNTSLIEKGNILQPTILEKQIEKDINAKD